MIIAIDPGTSESAFVLYGDGIVEFGKESNDLVLHRLHKANECSGPFARASVLAIEMVASYGMPVGAEVFETCVWIGRFIQAFNLKADYVYRRDVKLHLCGQARAKDGNVRAALIDRFGGKAAAIGNKKQPGPLHGISGDVWQALAVAVTYADGATRKAA